MLENVLQMVPETRNVSKQVNFDVGYSIHLQDDEISSIELIID